MTTKRRYTICVDFDGVLHSFTSPFEEKHVIPDPPVAGAVLWLEEMRETFDVVVLSTRGSTEEGRYAIRSYLQRYGLSNAASLEVTAEKPPALVYIDDRGFRFDGKNFPTAKEIFKMKPWNKVKKSG